MSEGEMIQEIATQAVLGPSDT